MTTFGIDRKVTVGMIGLGIMGSSFAFNLLSRVYNVHVYNRTVEKAQPLVEKGAIFQSTPQELASVADIIMTSLTDEAAVDSVAFGKDGFLKGELIVLVGGNHEVFERYERFLKELGKSIIYLGEDDNGHKMKLAINLHLGLLAESFSEALVFSQKLGFDTRTFVETINKTPIGYYVPQGKGSKIVEGNFEPAFSLNNLLKDLRLINAQITKTRAMLPMTKVAIEEYSGAMENDEGQKDFSVIALEIQRKNGLT